MGIVSRKDAKHAKFGENDLNYTEGRFSKLFSELCGLCAFARDIPNFASGSAALGTS